MAKQKISVAGLQIDPITKQALIEQIDNRIARGEQTFVITPYSEFLYHAVRDREVMQLLNSAHSAVADGIGIFWAHYFLSLPFSVQNFYWKVAQAWWHVVQTSLVAVFQQQKLFTIIPKKIVGAELVWDLAELASQKHYSVYLLGGHDNTPHLVAKKLQKRFPKLHIVGTSNRSPDDTSVTADISAAAPDMLFVAYGPLKQEQWIRAHLDALPVKFAIGLGGTFDYIAGLRSAPPSFIRRIGLEWLYRLITQPHRVGRIVNATYGLILSLVRYKVFMSTPYRENAVAVVVNHEKKVLICRRRPNFIGTGRKSNELDNYWQFPQGGVDEHEDISTAATRELAEETGIHSVEYLAISEHHNSYLWGNANRNLIGNRFKFKGQDQRTVYFRFTGFDSEIHLDERELIEYRWVTLEELPAAVAAERQPHAVKVAEELSRLLGS